MLVSTALGQQALAPTQITVPIKNRGVYSVATGSWTPVDLTAAATSDVLFNNTAPSAYFFADTFNTPLVVDHGRIPGTTASGITGTADLYEVDCYQFAYCSNDTNPVDQISVFFERYAPCSDVKLPGVTAVAGFIATGLPSGSATGGLNCWVISFDLSNTTLTFLLAADGDGTFDDEPNLDSFGWLPNYPTTTAGLMIGPVVSGNCAGTGGAVSSPPQGFGTAFAGVPGASNATGLGTDDFFWAGGGPPGPVPSNGGCFFFGGCNNQLGVAANPWGGFWLQLFGGRGEADRPGTKFCSSLPNVSGERAQISAEGAPDASLVLTASPVPNTLGQFFYGPMALPGTTVLGDGLLCVGGMLTRLTPFVTAGMMMQLPNTATFVADYTATYAAGLVGTQHFQHWFRSGIANGTGSNSSDAISISF